MNRNAGGISIYPSLLTQLLIRRVAFLPPSKRFLISPNIKALLSRSGSLSSLFWRAVSILMTFNYFTSLKIPRGSLQFLLHYNLATKPAQAGKKRVFP